ncbi:MAG TPA: hypothetical protein VNJ04_21310 [Gemmatimonadaceae bacterium]|nr:hypothetical protein [Gemmatimonadaceae bacterium]
MLGEDPRAPVGGRESGGSADPGRMAFRAPPPLHDFLRNIDIMYVATALNPELVGD